MKFLTSGLISAALALSAAQAQAVTNLAVNGSFEQVAASTVFTNGVAQVTGPNSTALSNWVTASSSQFQLNRNYAASDGGTSVDLSGAGGSIFTSINNFVVGKTYRVTFDLSGNPGASVDPRVLVAASSIGTIGSYTFARPPGQTAGNMGWVRVFANFVATSTLHRIAFTNNNLVANRTFGPVIDNVIIAEAVPEPQDWVLFIIGLGMIGAVSRRRVRQYAA